MRVPSWMKLVGTLVGSVGCATRTAEMEDWVAEPPDSRPITVADLTPTHDSVGTAQLSPEAQSLLTTSRLERDTTFDRLAQLCDGIGHRLAGSEGMERAVEWSQRLLETDGHASVRVEPVSVPVWVRGEESLHMLEPVSRELGMLGLGNSVGTNGVPVEASVVVADSLEAVGPDVEGKVVLFDVPMGTTPPMIQHYGANVQFRTQGPVVAAQHGAVGALVRSVTSRSLYTPHTGATRIAEDAVPAAAIPTEDAAWIRRLVEAGTEVRVRLAMEAEMAPDEGLSHNVVAEVRGATHPDEIVVIGAHLDSWDVGQGAHDDGAGVVEVIEALRHIRELKKAPARTIRVVLFTNEENGLRGGKAYAAEHGQEHHVAAIESDLGGGWPLSWGASGTPEQLAWLRAAAAPLGMAVSEGGGGADISPLADHGVLRIGLRPDDTHYFDVHHTAADTLDKVDPASLAEATGAVAVLAWQLANADAPPEVAPEAAEAE